MNITIKAQEFEEILKIARKASVIKYMFYKITDIQYTFVKIRLYHL